MTRDVQTVIYLRERIAVLRRQSPQTAAGREALDATIQELEDAAAAVSQRALLRSVVHMAPLSERV